ISGSQPILFDYESVKKIKMGLDKEVSVYNFKENGWYFRSQFSVLYQKEIGGVSLSQSVGYHYKHWLTAGVGIGLDNYYTEPGNNIYPLFVEIRSYLQKKNVSPYLALRSGYSMIKPDPEFGQTDAKGDIFFNPVFGYRLGAGRPFIDLFVGMKFQSAEYHTRSSQSQSITNIDFRRYDFGIGMTF
ncbi:MAG: hypothetical protein WAU01_17235, partial [Saprospiraceae bacterium]